MEVSEGEADRLADFVKGRNGSNQKEPVKSR